MVNVAVGQKGFTSAPLEQRFWAKVERRGPDDCWPWRGANCAGYGQIWLNGSNRRATQVSWEIANGSPFPDGKMACHTCDNPACVNPAHIWPGSMSDNILDCVAKGRHVPARTPHNRGISHCKHGHEFTPEKTHLSPRGFRVCKACRDAYRKTIKMTPAQRARKTELQRIARAALKGATP